MIPRDANILRLLTLAILFATSSPLLADNWPNWRGPTQNGVATGKSYPIQWDTEKNVVWKLELAGEGSSTPVVWGERIFVTSVKKDNLVTCYNRDGKEVWQRKIGAERKGKHRKATGANPSPATDGRHVFAYFKSGDLAAFDFDGKPLWSKNLQTMYGEDTLWWDLGTSPVLTKNAVVVACMQTGGSYVVAFEKASGKVLWKRDRDLGAPSEAAQSYTTPLVLTQNGRETIVIVGADHVTSHDAASGEEQWRVGGLNPTNHKFFRSICSPVASDGVVIAPYARGASLTAVRVGGKGDVTDSHVAWSDAEEAAADVPTPIAVDGRLYVCRDRGELICRDLKTGAKLWTHPKPRKGAFSSSPILAAGKVYLTSEQGQTYVIQVTGNKPKLLASNDLKEQTVATPVFVDGQILIRTLKHLYCIGK